MSQFTCPVCKWNRFSQLFGWRSMWSGWSRSGSSRILEVQLYNRHLACAKWHSVNRRFSASPRFPSAQYVFSKATQLRLQSRIAAAICQVVRENLLYEKPPSRRRADREQWTIEFGILRMPARWVHLAKHGRCLLEIRCNSRTMCLSNFRPKSAGILYEKPWPRLPRVLVM
jgi:hypothetical protein